MKKIFYFFIFLTIMITGCFHVGDVKVFKIGTNLWPGYEALHLAKIHNEYKNEIDVIAYDSATIVLNKFRNKEIEAAALTLDEVILLKDQGYDPVIVAVLDISNGADVMLSKPNIISLSDLKGKRIGVENSALGSYILARVLELSKLSRSDIQFVPLNVNQHSGAYRDDIVDAVITFEPVRSELLQIGAKELFTSKEISGEIVDVLVVRKEFKNSKYVEDILNAWSKSIEKILAKDEKSISLVAKNLNQTNEEFITSLDGLILPTLYKSNEMIRNGSLFLTIQKIEKIMIDEKLIKKNIDIESIL